MRSFEYARLMTSTMAGYLAEGSTTSAIEALVSSLGRNIRQNIVKCWVPKGKQAVGISSGKQRAKTRACHPSILDPATRSRVHRGSPTQRAATRDPSAKQFTPSHPHIRTCLLCSAWNPSMPSLDSRLSITAISTFHGEIRVRNPRNVVRAMGS